MKCTTDKGDEVINRELHGLKTRPCDSLKCENFLRACDSPKCENFLSVAKVSYVYGLVPNHPECMFWAP